MGLTSERLTSSITMTDEFRQAVYDAWGRECLICGRTPEGWLQAAVGGGHQDKLSLHHLNGDDTDDRIANAIPLCQSCHVHIHRVDEPPYRQWHRQLPIADRHAWNAHRKEYAETPQLTAKEAAWRYGDDDGTPRSTSYLRYERDVTDPDDEFNTEAIWSDGGHREQPTDIQEATIEYTLEDSGRYRIRFVERHDGPGWWRVVDKWTDSVWHPVDRKPIADVDVILEYGANDGKRSN